MADGHNDDGVAVRDFSFLFETLAEITKAWKKWVKDTRFLKFLLQAGQARALDLIHRLDKDHGGTLTIREFVFGMNENKTLPKNITLDDLWSFAKHFDNDGTVTFHAVLAEETC